MHSTKIKSLLALVGLACLSGGSSLLAQTVQKQVNATLPYPVVVSEKTLEPGKKYTLREIANHVVQVYDGDKMRAEATVNTIDTEDKQPAKETKLILYKFGDTGNFYIAKMWIQGRVTGYEFPLPERLKTLKREREESLSAQYEEKHEAEGLK